MIDRHVSKHALQHRRLISSLLLLEREYESRKSEIAQIRDNINACFSMGLC